MQDNEIVLACLEASGGDAEAALEAARLLSTSTVEELSGTVTDGGVEHHLRGFVDEFGVTHLVSVPLSQEEQRSLNERRDAEQRILAERRIAEQRILDQRRKMDRSHMNATLSVLDTKLERMAPSITAAMALCERCWKLM